MNIRLIGIILALGLMLGGLVLSDRFYDTEKASSPRAVDAYLQGQTVTLYRTLKESFPDEYRRLVSKLSGALKAGEPQATIAGIAEAAMLDVRRAHADVLLGADSSDLAAIVGMSRDLHVDVRAREGEETCDRFAISGAVALGGSFEDYLTALDRQGAAMLDLIARTRDAGGGAQVAPATAADWGALRADAATDGAAAADLMALATLDPQRGDICAALGSMLGHLAHDDSDRGRRLRAAYVRDLARN